MVPIEEILRDLNPWWEDGEVRPAEERGWVLRRRKEEKVLRHLLSRDRRALVLRGPRQVGKTVLLLQAAEDLLHRFQVPPRCLVYFDFSDDRIVERVTPRDVLEHLPSKGKGDAPRYFLLDEIGKSPRWGEWLKQAVDRDWGRILVTDSSAALLQSGSRESGQGRWDELLMETLSFEEFLEFQGSEGGESDTFFRNHPRPRQLLERFLRFGGYPEHAGTGVDELLALSRIKEDLVARALVRGLSPLGVNLEEVRRLFVSLVQDSGGKFRAKNISDDLGVVENTIKKWVDLIEGTMLLQKLERWTARPRGRARKEFKLYASDPNMVYALAVGGGGALAGKLFEAAVYRHLRGAMPFLKEAFSDHGLGIYFFRRGKGGEGGEIDFLLAGGTVLAGIEVTSSPVDGEKVRRFREVLGALETLSPGKRKARGILVHGGIQEKKTPFGLTIPLGVFLLHTGDLLVEES